MQLFLENSEQKFKKIIQSIMHYKYLYKWSPRNLFCDLEILSNIPVLAWLNFFLKSGAGIHQFLRCGREDWQINTHIHCSGRKGEPLSNPHFSKLKQTNKNPGPEVTTANVSRLWCPKVVPHDVWSLCKTAFSRSSEKCSTKEKVDQECCGFCSHPSVRKGKGGTSRAYTYFSFKITTAVVTIKLHQVSHYSTFPNMQNN